MEKRSQLMDSRFMDLTVFVNKSWLFLWKKSCKIWLLRRFVIVISVF